MTGRLLNLVEKTPYRCPHCPKQGRQMEVYMTCVRWVCCGHTTTLPPLHLGEAWVRACRACTPEPLRAVA
ncbi:hypothetical protein B1813_18850 [Saccharomonospora piscinae]|uniref:Uncharacterized protein n=1 Tax=Saccharomonospora piscinae TaxID=687388 RepID=A0A1V8ZYN9_SACPI|nr:hypothetical protein [Saccharomonospora piscinae]OQO89901.1 hypothetical protein B1813_18850 [Saccharomonospora piscinae]